MTAGPVVKDANAYIFNTGTLGAVTDTLPDIGEGNYNEATLVDPTPSFAQYVWDLGSAYNDILVFISTDHVAGNTFAFDAWGSNDLTNWSEGTFTKAYSTDAPDDYATQWAFDTAKRYIGVQSFNTMTFTESDASPSLLANISPKGEFEGAASRLPEPSTVSLLASGLGVLGFAFRRKFKAE